jgi:hypothetical protein
MEQMDSLLEVVGQQGLFCEFAFLSKGLGNRAGKKIFSHRDSKFFPNAVIETRI